MERMIKSYLENSKANRLKGVNNITYKTNGFNCIASFYHNLQGGTEDGLTHLTVTISLWQLMEHFFWLNNE